MAPPPPINFTSPSAAQSSMPPPSTIKCRPGCRASEDTWSEGPFGGNPDSSISYYQKSPAIGLLLDLAIRHHTANKKSLDDVMRTQVDPLQTFIRKDWLKE